MNVLLIFPKTEIQVPIEGKPPLGLLYIASSLELDGHKVMIEDMYTKRTTMEQLIQNAQKFKPDTVGISVLTPYVKAADTIAKCIKQHFDIPVIIGGPHPSSIPEKTLNDYSVFDIAVKGEGEETTRELCRVLELGGDISTVKGISYKRDDGKIVSTPPRPLIENLDDIPFPAWHLIQIDEYFKATSASFEAGGRKAFSMITSRGCPGRCMFCDSHDIWTRRYRQRSATNVIDEVKELYKKYNVRYIFFNDDTLIVNKKRISEICAMIQERGLDIKWHCYGRVDLVDEDILRKMKNAGCVKISYGIESGSQKTLDYIKKNITLEQAEHAINITNRVGIKSHAFWMIGFPDETEEDIRKTIEFNKKLPLDDHDTFSILTPFPGSELYKIFKEEGLLLSEDWDSYYNRRVEGVLPVVRTHHLSNEDLYRLKQIGDHELIRATRNRRLKYYLMHPDEMIIRGFNDPKNLLHGAFWLAKNEVYIKFKSLFSTT